MIIQKHAVPLYPVKIEQHFLKAILWNEPDNDFFKEKSFRNFLQYFLMCHSIGATTFSIITDKIMTLCVKTLGITINSLAVTGNL
jgi:hypothetical protein